MTRDFPSKTVAWRWSVGGVVAAASMLIAGGGVAFAGVTARVGHRAPAARAEAVATGDRSPIGAPHRQSSSNPPTRSFTSTLSAKASGPSQTFGPVSGLHVRVEGTASTGYRAVIYDGETFVTGRGMVGPWDLTVVPRVELARTVSCTLGKNNTCSGLAQQGYPDDGNTRSVEFGGLSARKTAAVLPDDQNMYFNVDNTTAFSTRYSATFTVEYYDQGTGSWLLQYESTRPAHGRYAPAGTVKLHNSGRWKTVSFSVSDARFAHRENGGNDFRIASRSAVIVHSVSVRVTGQLRAAVARLENRYTRVSYSPAQKTLTLSGAVNTLQGTTVSRSESYRFVGTETIASTVGIQSDEAAAAWYSPYTDFPAGWEPMWAGGYAALLHQSHDR